MSETATLVTSKSEALFEKAQDYIPGGVNSPVRAMQAVHDKPIFISKADGAHLFDVDGNKYIDYVGSWGPMILGHRHPRILEALEDALDSSTSYGACSPAEVEIAQLICQLVPSIEMVRMVNSGTEACMSAIRLARAFTKKDMIIKFDGCYHGHADSFLVKAGSGLATLGIASSPGIPEELSKLTLSLPYNDPAALKKAFSEHGDKIAAIIVEPVIGNSGLILPKEGYLQELRDLCTKHNALLIFDEVMTGFRVALGGAQEKFGIKPDLTCLGKIIGGGLPVGAYGGRKDIMSMIAPLGPVYQAGTLSGNPFAMAAGLAQLKMISIPHTYDQLEQRTNRLAQGMQEIAKETKHDVQISSVTGMLSIFFCKDEVTDFESAKNCDTEKFAKFWQGLKKRGIYWPPSQFEAAFVSLIHSKLELDETLQAISEALKEI